MTGFEYQPKFNPEDQPVKIEPPSQSPVEQVPSPSSSKIMEPLGGAKERISAYFKYKELKVKEYFGKLSQEDFYQLLNLDFQAQVKDNPPIEGVFSPEHELDRIKSLPREQKREALTTYKEKLIRQRRALAACRLFIEKTIEFNHDIQRGKLLGLVELFAVKYGFDERQKQIIEQLIDGYYENRQKVLEIRRQFPDDHELLKQITELDIDKNEKVDVSVGPMTIDIGADGFIAGRLFERSDKPVISLKYGGFASQSIGEPAIFYIVINKDEWVRQQYKDRSGRKIQKHEYEHQKNKLFREVF